MKRILLSIVVMITMISANAQSDSNEKDFKFGIGGTLGLPTGDLAIFSNFVYGGDIKGEYTVAPNIAANLSIGYIRFNGKSGYTISDGLIPILVGGKYHFSEKVYGQAQLGLSISTASGGGSAFTYVPSVGFDIDENFNIELKYQAASKNGTLSFVGLRIGRTF